MGTYGGPKIISDGLTLFLDAANHKSYPGTGTVWNDLSGGGNTATLTNGPTFVSGLDAQIVFDGSNDVVTIPDYDYGRSGCTVSAWGKWHTDNSNGNIVSKWQTGAGNNNEFLLSSNDSSTSPYYPRFHIFNTDNNKVKAIGTEVMSADTWYYLVGTFDGTNSRVYLDGSLSATSGASSSALIKTYTPQVIKIASFDSGYYNNIDVAMVSIHNRALSSTEILHNYNATKHRFI